MPALGAWQQASSWVAVCSSAAVRGVVWPMTGEGGWEYDWQRVHLCSPVW